MDTFQSVERSTSVDRRTFVKATGALAGAAALTSTLGDTAFASLVPSGATYFEPLANPIRVLDTREPGNYSQNYSEVTPGRLRRVPLTSMAEIPNDATAVVATLTGIRTGSPVYVQMIPKGQNPANVITSNLNLFLGANANLATVQLSADGGIDIYSSNVCEVIVDVLGVYRPTSAPVAAGRFVALDSPSRPLQTFRNPGEAVKPHPASGAILKVPLGAHMRAAHPSIDLSEVHAVMANVTATQSTGPGHISVVPGDTPDAAVGLTSSLNVNRFGEIRASAVVVRVSHEGGEIYAKIYVHTSTHIAFDVFGYFTNSEAAASSTGLFVPATPQRIMDTRDANQSSIDYNRTKGRLWPGWSIEGTLPASVPDRVQAAVLNVTMTQPRGAGHVTVFGARRQQPNTSNVNHDFESAAAYWDIPNLAVTAVTKHGYQAFTWGGTALVVDYFGYYTGDRLLPQLGETVNAEPGPIGPEWTLYVPKMARDGGPSVTTVKNGDATYLTDNGYSWHWTGTGDVGNYRANNSVIHTAVFGHRTESTAPYYNIHTLGPGDRWEVHTQDGRVYIYEYVRRDLTDAQNDNILAATRFVEGRSMSLIACTYGLETKLPRREWWEPTDLDYRIIVTGKLVDWYTNF